MPQIPGYQPRPPMGGAQMQNPPRGVPGLQRGGQPAPQRRGPQPQMQQQPGPQGMSPLAALALMALMQQRRAPGVR